MTVRNAQSEITKRAFADTFGVSEAQLERFFQQGMPHEKASSRKIMIPMPSGREWYKNYLVEKGKRQAAPKNIDEAKQRKMAAEAELAELELSKARDELMTVTQYDRAVLDAFSRVDVKLQNLSQRLAGVVLGSATIQESQARIDPLIEEARTELRQSNDVPVIDDDESEDIDAESDE